MPSYATITAPKASAETSAADGYALARSFAAALRDGSDVNVLMSESFFTRGPLDVADIKREAAGRAFKIAAEYRGRALTRGGIQKFLAFFPHVSGDVDKDALLLYIYVMRLGYSYKVFALERENEQ